MLEAGCNRPAGWDTLGLIRDVTIMGQFAVTLDTPSDILIPPLEAANGWAWALPLET